MCNSINFPLWLKKDKYVMQVVENLRQYVLKVDETIRDYVTYSKADQGNCSAG